MRVRWACPRCEARGTTRLEVRIVYHRCIPKRRRRLRAPLELPPNAVSREEQLRGLWADLGGGL